MENSKQPNMVLLGCACIPLTVAGDAGRQCFSDYRSHLTSSSTVCRLRQNSGKSVWEWIKASHWHKILLSTSWKTHIHIRWENEHIRCHYMLFCAYVLTVICHSHANKWAYWLCQLCPGQCHFLQPGLHQGKHTHTYILILLCHKQIHWKIVKVFICVLNLHNRLGLNDGK